MLTVSLVSLSKNGGEEDDVFGEKDGTIGALFWCFFVFLVGLHFFVFVDFCWVGTVLKTKDFTI